jgi:preprotein translocase subunit SecD
MKPLFVCAMLALVLSCRVSSCASDAVSTTPSSMPAQSELAKNVDVKLPDGLYLVLKSSRVRSELGSSAKNCVVVANDFHLLEPEEREPTQYLLVQRNPFIPLHLGTDPVEDTEQRSGKPRLSLQLAADQKQPLEEFTRQHQGETVVIVIGGEPVTSHKVKTAITGGALQITRCTKHGCETLFTTLLKNRKSNN